MLGFGASYIRDLTVGAWYSTFIYHIDGLVQERRHSSALAMELSLSCINPSILTFQVRISYIYIYIWDPKVVIIMPAEVLAPVSRVGQVFFQASLTCYDCVSPLWIGRHQSNKMCWQACLKSRTHLVFRLNRTTNGCAMTCVCSAWFYFAAFQINITDYICCTLIDMINCVYIYRTILYKNQYKYLPFF